MFFGMPSGLATNELVINAQQSAMTTSPVTVGNLGEKARNYATASIVRNEVILKMHRVL